MRGRRRTLLGALTLALLAGCSQPAGERLRVVATTSHVSELVQRIGGDRVAVRLIIPPGSCPGHYDVKPRDVEALARSGVMVQQGFEPCAEDLVKSAKNPSLRVITAPEGNLMLPGPRAEAAAALADALAEAYPKHAEFFRDRGERLAREIKRQGEAQRERARQAQLDGVPVIGSDMQQDWLEWMGMRVVATYGRSEELKPDTIRGVLEQARKERVKIVVDNIQSGPDTGEQMASELGAEHVVVSNFPGEKPEENWAATLEQNVSALIAAKERTS